VESLVRQDFAGDVYLARDSQSERLVECLMIHLPPERVKRLLALREQIGEVKQVNLKSFANTYGIGKQAGFGYMVRQQLEGRTLTEYLNHRLAQNKPFKQRALCSLLIEIIQGLDALLKQEPNVRSHGLLRPSAILVQNKSKPRVRMTDLGLSVLRYDLKDNAERDLWTIGCVPELRGEATPQEPDLYSLGALLYQMTHLRSFNAQWREDFTPIKTFERLPELIERCTSADQDISLFELKEALKVAARAQVEEGGLTDDLSQLQERLHKIMNDGEGAPQRPSELLSGEESISGIFSHGVDEHSSGEAGDPQERNLYQTPLPMSFQTPLPSALSLQETRRVSPTPPPSDVEGAEPSVDMSHFNMAGFESELSAEPIRQAKRPTAQAPVYEDGSSDELLSSSRASDVQELLAKVETFHGAELVLDAPPPPPPAPAPLPKTPTPPPPPPPRAVDPSAPRWLVMRNGVDYGPYAQEQIIKQLFALEISPDTELCDLETGARMNLAEFPEMEPLLATWAHKRAEFEAAHAERVKRERFKRQLTLTLAAVFTLGLSIGGYVYGPALYESTLPPPAELSLSAWTPSFPQLEPLERLEESPEVRAERKRQAQAARARRAANEEARAMAREAREASTVNVDLNGGSVGRSFSKATFQKALNTRLSKLQACIQSEMGRSPSVSTFKVSMTVQPSGRFLNARLEKGSNPGQRCVFRAIRNLKMPPFDGTDRTITVPFKVR
jgi:hypothetical protein